MENINLDKLFNGDLNNGWDDGSTPKHYFFSNNPGDQLSDNKLEHMYLYANNSMKHYDFIYYNDGRKISYADNPFPKIAMNELVLFAVFEEITRYFNTWILYFRSVKTGRFYLMDAFRDKYEDDYQLSEFEEEYRIKYPHPFASKIILSENELEPGTVAFGKEIYTAKRRKYIISTL